MFINFTNHPSVNWNNEQTNEALQYGEIVDINFPNVPTNYDENEIAVLADECVKEIMNYQPRCVLCQGEFTLAFCVINRLLGMGIEVVSACTERIVCEEKDINGDLRKTTLFKFDGFRKYVR